MKKKQESWREMRSRSHQMPEPHRGEQGPNTRPCDKRQQCFRKWHGTYLKEPQSASFLQPNSAEQTTELPVCTLHAGGYLCSAHMVTYPRLLVSNRPRFSERAIQKYNFPFSVTWAAWRKDYYTTDVTNKYIWWQHWWHTTAYGMSLCHKQWQLVMILYYKKLKFTILTLFFSTNFSSSVFLLNNSVQSWTWYSTWGLTCTDFS